MSNRTGRGTRTRLAVSLLVPALVAACGDPAIPVAPPPDDMASMHQHTAALGLADGEYVAQLHPMNAKIQNGMDPDPRDGPRGVATGKAYFTIRGGEFIARIDAKGLEPDVIHPEHIHAASACPPASADVNGDGIVDVIEGVPFYGPILIPLDSDLSSQGAGTFPTASGLKGNLNYMASTSFSALLADLNAPDPDPTDAVIKLGGAPLSLATRHVILHGVDLNTFLPPSVQSLGTVPAQLTLPVACGTIRRIG